MKALDEAYPQRMGSYEGSKSSNWGGAFMPIFAIESIKKWGPIESYFDDFDRQDVIDKLIEKRQDNVDIVVWSPLKLEGFHSLHMEKAMRYRYSNYNSDGWPDMKKMYSTESTQAANRAGICSPPAMPRAIKEWEGIESD
jgi:hypothetical protein